MFPSFAEELEIEWFGRIHQNMLECTYDLVPETLMLSYQIVAAEVKLRDPGDYYSAIKNAGTDLRMVNGKIKSVYDCSWHRERLSAPEHRQTTLKYYLEELEDVVAWYKLDQRLIKNIDLKDVTVNYYQFTYLNQSHLISRSK